MLHLDCTFTRTKKAPARWPIKINKPGLQTLCILTFRNYAICFLLHGIPWNIWSRMQRTRGSNHLYFPIKAFCIYICLQKNPSSKSPEMVDAPEFSQAHLYRLVNMVAGAGIPSYVRQLKASELLPPQTYFRSFSKLLRRCFPVLVQALLASSNSSQKLFSAGISVTAVSQIISRLMLP